MLLHLRSSQQRLTTTLCGPKVDKYSSWECIGALLVSVKLVYWSPLSDYFEGLFR